MALFSGSIRSGCLGGNTWVQVATPDTMEYDTPKRVIYVLHGTTGHSIDWVRFTRLPLYAEEYGVVFVMPEIGNAWAKDVPFLGRYFSFLTEELPDQICALFNVSANRNDTAIVGNSSGGFSALKCGLRRGDRFGLCAGFSSGGLYIDEYFSSLRRLPPDIRENRHLHITFGPDLEYDEDDVLLECARTAVHAGTLPDVYLAVGDLDPLLELNARFARDLSAAGLPVRYETWAGGHDWYFWDEALKRFLDFYYRDLTAGSSEGRDPTPGSSEGRDTR